MIGNICCDTPGPTSVKNQAVPKRMASVPIMISKGIEKVYIKLHQRIPRTEVSAVQPPIVRKGKKSGPVWIISVSIVCECMTKRAPTSMIWSGSQLLSQTCADTCSIDNYVGPSWMLDRRFNWWLTMGLPIIKSSRNTLLIVMEPNYHVIPIYRRYKNLRLLIQR